MTRVFFCLFLLFAMTSAMAIQPISVPVTDPTVGPISPPIDILPYPYYPYCCCYNYLYPCYYPIATTNAIAKPAIRCLCPYILNTAEAQAQ